MADESFDRRGVTHRLSLTVPFSFQVKRTLFLFPLRAAVSLPFPSPCPPAKISDASFTTFFSCFGRKRDGLTCLSLPPEKEAQHQVPFSPFSSTGMVPLSVRTALKCPEVSSFFWARSDAQTFNSPRQPRGKRKVVPPLQAPLCHHELFSLLLEILRPFRPSPKRRSR